MAETDKKIYVQYKYKVEMTYLNLVKDISTDIKNECVKTIIIDNNYDVNSMPILYATLKLDKSLVDDMILNIDTNLIILAIYKYNILDEEPQDIEVFRDKFTYFLPDDVNKNNAIDYNEANDEEHLGNTFRDVSIGLMPIKMINNNKRYTELNVVNNTVYDCAKYCLSHLDNLVLEPFSFNDKQDRIIMPAQESIRKALEFLNSYKVFYYTPFRFYQDFKYSYLISSSGRAIPKDNEQYSSIVVEIRDTDEIDANEEGLIINKTSGSYEVVVNFVNASVYDNTIANKSYNKLKGISSTGTTEKTLSNSASYSTDKVHRVRLNNDNENMIYNIEADRNNKNILVYFSKTDLDMDLFTINKKISIHHIDRYQDCNGDYLLYRKRECLIREDESFVLETIINMRKIEKSFEELAVRKSII